MFSHILNDVRALPFAFLAALSALADPGVDFFEAKVRPLLAAKCYGCHSAKLPSPMAGLRFDDPKTVRSAVKPNDPDASRLIQAVRYQSVGMPPGGKLKENEIADLVKWVELGAPVPAASFAGGCRQSTCAFVGVVSSTTSFPCL